MSKKTETIELRVSPELKSDLGALSRDRGQPMSETIRQLIAREVAATAQGKTIQGDFGMSTRAQGRRLATAGAVALTLAGVGFAIAAQSDAYAQAEARRTFAEFDVNADGKVTRDEVGQVMQEMIGEFRAAAPSGGTPACQAALKDFEASLEAIAGAEFSDMDANGDGEVVYAEVRAAMVADRQAEFTSLDENGDGAIAFAEFSKIDALFEDEDETAEDDLFAAGEAACFAEDEGLEPLDSAFEARILRIEFAELDQNMDGSLTRSEFVSN
ncbi:hypothetical protein [Pelagibius sp.]|uniref:hypothetical protein n=1 Tax=Pelagibius sp. TaxID=1931238 RepID=UPI002607E9BA|nr:hypothetical protein [Pelagibius sp.]